MARTALAALLVLTGLLAQAQSMAALERRCGARLGVMAVDTGSGRTLAHRADERFAMCSTFKLLLAAMVLARVDAGKESLDRVLPYGPADLLEYAPVTRSRLGERGMTVGALCEATLDHSDNTAANLLLAAMGGPEAFTRFARSLGDPVTRLDRCEPALNAPEPGKTLDSTSPRAMLESLRRELLGDGLSAPSRARLQGWLLASATGDQRLKAGLPPGWRIGHKTGSGADGAAGDIGILYPPGRPPILVTAYLASGAPPAERDPVLAEVGRMVAAEFSRP